MVTHHETEIWLKSYAVEFELVSMRVSQLDFDSTGQNREDRQPREIEEMYAAGYTRGDAIPPLVAWAGDGASVLFKRPKIIDGYTRGGALKIAKIAEVDVYLVRCHELVYRQLTLTANSRHGTRPSTIWQLEQAVSLVADFGMSIKDAAQRANVHPSALGQRRQIKEAERRARRLGVQGPFGGLAAKPKTLLGSLADDAVFVEAVRFVHAACWGEFKIRESVRHVYALGDEADWLD